MVQAMMKHTPAEEALIREIGENADSATAEKFGAQGLPHRRIEEWKYTDLRSFWREPLLSAPQPDAGLIAEAEALAPKAENACVLTFVNGWLTSKENVPEGMTIHPVQNDTAMKFWSDPMMDLNASLTGATVMITIPSGKKIEPLLNLNFRMVGAASSTSPRVHIQAGDDSELNILETHVSADQGYALNSTLLITCGKNSNVSHSRVQALGNKVINVISTDVRLGQGAHFKAFAMEEGAALSRNQYFIRQTGKDAVIDLAGVTLGKGRQHLDTTLIVDHTVSNGISRETYKQVLTENATGVFQGKIIVQPHAQKTDGKMSARGLLLSDGAAFFAKPELEIYADDVLCAHGATAGALDEDLLFYLRARGIPFNTARALLVSAFVGEALEKVDFEPLRDALRQRCDIWLKEALN